jgi:hypothetical protein
MKEGRAMDRERFDTLLEAYGADFTRWPANERAAGAAFAAQHAAEVGEAIEAARALDASLNAARGVVGDLSALSARIMAAAPRRKPGFDRRAVFALAACAVFGVLIGYGGGLLTPPSEADEAYFALTFEAPLLEEEG